MRVVVLGAGFGGLELTTRLSDELGDDVDVTLIDQADGFIFGFSKLDVMFGKAQADAVHHAYADIVKPGVRFVQTHHHRRSIPWRSTSRPTRARSRPTCWWWRSVPTSTRPPRPVCSRRATSSTRCRVPSRAATCSHDFDGGRVIVAVTSTPFKCPPAPSETALLVHDFLVQRGLRDRSEIALVMPMGVPIPPSPAASKALLAAFEERGITWHPEQVVRGLDPATKVARMADGGEMPFDLFLGVPVHRVPEVVAHRG